MCRRSTFEVRYVIPVGVSYSSATFYSGLARTFRRARAALGFRLYQPRADQRSARFRDLSRIWWTRQSTVPQQASPQSGLVASLPTRASRSRRRMRLAPATDIINMNAAISTRLPTYMASLFPTPSILALLIRGTPRTRMPMVMITTLSIRAGPPSSIAADQAPHLTSRPSAVLLALTLFRMPRSRPLIPNRRKSRLSSYLRMAASWNSEITPSSDRRSSI